MEFHDARRKSRADDHGVYVTTKFRRREQIRRCNPDEPIYTTTDGTDDSTLWTATSNGTNYFIESVNVSGRKLQFNYNSGNSRFACYATSQNPIIIETVTAPEVDNVTVYGDATANANNEISVTKDFLYEVTYVDNNNTGTSAVTVSVLNSGSTTDGAFVSTAPSNGEFSVTFTANDTFTVTVTSSEDTNKFDSITITVSNIYIPVLNDFNLYGGTNVSGNIKLVEGDYIITYDNCALNTTISSSRAQYSEITPVNDVIATSDTSIVWRIQPSGNYYTIYNASVDKYLASTGAQNKAQLLEDGTDDKSLWSVEIDGNGKFNFVNKQNDANSVNANLRKNGTYGFACYGSNTGDVLTLYRMDIDGYIDTTISTATIHGHENYTAEVLTSVDSVAIRFGASISKHTWNSIDSELGITDYGVMLMKASDKTSGGYSSIEDAYDKHTSSSVLKDIHKCQNETPFAVPELNGTTYIFTVKVNFPNDSQYYDDVIYAAPYIVADGHYYFLSEMHTSVQDLALDYYNTGYEYLSDAALTMLAGI